jgi:nitrogen fixation NifU-like protein
MMFFNKINYEVMILKSTQYSDKVLDHFKNPRNVGTLEGDDVAVGRVGNPVCGDLMEIAIRVIDDKIEDIKFQTFGCGSAIATSSMITEIVLGKTLDEAIKVTRKDVADELDGLPPIKMHCSNLAADALHAAIKAWREKKQSDKKEIGETSETQVKQERKDGMIVGFHDYLEKGIFFDPKDVSKFKEQRVIVIEQHKEALEIALKLIEVTERVVLITAEKTINGNGELQNKLKDSKVKILYQSQIIEVAGEGELEKLKILNLDEDEEYYLFSDALIVMKSTECII